MGNFPKKTGYSQDNFFDLRNLFELVLAHWKWIVLSALVCVGGAYYYASTLPSTYQRSAVLLVKDEDKLGSDKLAAILDPIGIDQSSSIDNELYTLNSILIMSEVVTALNLEVDYTQQQGLRRVSLFHEVPFELHFLDPYEVPVGFDVVAYDERGLTLVYPDGEAQRTERVVAYGDTVVTPMGTLLVQPRTLKRPFDMTAPVHVARIDPDVCATLVQSKIKTSSVSKKGTLVKITCTDQNLGRADAILSALMDIYTETIVADKNKVATNTARFIDERILVISDELGDVENQLTEFKQEHGIVDIQSKAATSLAEGSQAKAQSIELSAQLKVADYVRNFVTDASKRNALIPNVSGIGDVGLQSQIQEYNELVLRCNRLMENSGEENSVVQELSRQLTAMRTTISGSLSTYCSTLALRIGDARKQESRARRNISSIPLQEKKVLDVMRQQKIKEALYTFLLQTREEIAMQLAATEANLRVVEPPHGSKVPIAPDRKEILLMALAFGLVLPLGIIFLRRAIDTGVRGKRDIEQYTNIPILGSVPARKQVEHDGDLVVSEKKNDHITEAFRLLRTNLDFFKPEAQVLMFTSTMAHEGKSFVSRNFSVTLAFSGKRVLLVDTDIRKGKQDILLDMKRKEGVTTYLNGNSRSLSELIVPRALGGCVDFLPSGLVPPNPSELLMKPRLDEMIDELKTHYDYIVLDNVPALVVADAAIVNRVADVTLYVVRDGMVDRRYLPELEQLHQDNKFKNMCIILNDVKEAKGGYGYGYGNGRGYGYYSDDKMHHRHAASRLSFLRKVFGRK